MNAEDLKSILRKHAEWAKSDGRAGERADLSGTDLSGADLSNAYLSGADLSGTDLSGTDLSGADLSGADLSGAYLSRADLSNADLSRADLSNAKLSNADLSGVSLSDANLRNADLSGANLCGAYLSGAGLAGAAGLPAAPAIEDIDGRILEEVNADGNRLKMASWHTCETAHCRAGWAIVLAGKAGKELEDKYGPSAAGALIYAASRPGVAVPSFHTSDEAALADLKRGAKGAPTTRLGYRAGEEG